MTKTQGFTLLELLIAMSLMGIVLVMIYSGLRLGMRSWEVGERYATELNDIRLVQGFLRRSLRQSQSVFRIDEDAQRVVVFSGSEQQLVLVSPLLTHLGLGGLYLMRLDMIDMEGVGQLRVRWQPYRPDTLEDDLDNDEEFESTILLSDVADVQWSYFGVEANDEEARWHERWVNTQQRPRVVRLSLNWHGEPWPDLLVTLPN